MTPKIDKEMLNQWLKEYFKMVLFSKLNPDQFKRYLEIKGFSATEQKYLVQEYRKQNFHRTFLGMIP